MKVIIPGKPIALQRARAFNEKGKILHWDSQRKEKEWVRRIMMNQVSNVSNWENLEDVKETISLLNCDQFFVGLDFHMPMPKNLSKSKINAIACGFSRYNKKPDIDNLVKFYLDCGNGILFSDDRMIVQLQASKVYSEEPKTIITVKPF